MISFTFLQPHAVDDLLLEKCSNLFSQHYGVWSENGVAPGKSVKLVPKRLKEQYLNAPNTFIVIAKVGLSEEVVGHAIGIKFYYEEGGGYITWITQLVVHVKYRNQGIAFRLCQLAWDPHNSYACGLVTSHPYAIKALERASGCDVDKDLIAFHGIEIIKRSNIKYIQDATNFLNQGRCVVNTNFFVSHTEVNSILSKMTDWKLGTLDDGEEFIAICFPGNQHRRLSGANNTPPRLSLFVPLAMALYSYLFLSNNQR